MFASIKCSINAVSVPKKNDSEIVSLYPNMEHFKTAQVQPLGKKDMVICNSAEKKNFHVKNRERGYLAYFITIPMKFSYALFISPFYLKLRNYQNTAFEFQEYYEVAMWLPQKILCGIFTLLDFFWMLGMVRDNIPKNERNPGQHVQCLIEVISLLHKCIAMKKFWLNHSKFAECTNFINKSNISVGRPHKWLPPRVLISATMCLYVIMALVRATDEFRGHFNYPRIDLDQWWKNKVDRARRNFIMAASTNHTDEYASPENVIFGILGIAGFMHR